MLASRRRRLLALGCGLALGGGVLAWRTDVLGRLRARYATATRLLRLYAQAGATGGELACTLLSDLQAFLTSDADALPPSLVQLSKLLSSQEATACSTAFITALFASAGTSARPSPSPPACQRLVGQAESGECGEALPSGVADRFLALLFSERGEGLISCAVGIAAKSSVTAVCSFLQQHQKGEKEGQQTRGEGTVEEEGDVARVTRALLQVITHPEGRAALSAFIATFVATGVSTYIDATNDHNYYEDIVASVATPSNRAAVEHISAHVCREAIGAYFSFTSSQAPPPSAGQDSPGHANEDGESICAEGEGVSKVLNYGEASVPKTASRGPAKSRPSDGVVGQLFRAASTSDGRRLVIDLASSVTAEAVRTTVGSLAEVTGWRTAPTRNGERPSAADCSGGYDEVTVCGPLSSRVSAFCALALALALLFACLTRWLSVGTMDLGIAHWQPPLSVDQT